MSGGWFFGLFQTKKGELVLCEIYDLEKRGIGAADVDWKQLRRDKEMILKDIAGQIKHKVEFREGKIGGVEMRINGKLKRKAVTKEPKNEKFYTQAEMLAMHPEWKSIFEPKKRKTKKGSKL